MLTHELVVGLEEICLEEGILEMTRETLDHKMTVTGAEKCLTLYQYSLRTVRRSLAYRSRVSQIAHRLQWRLAARRAETRLILILVKVPDLLA